MIDRYFATLPLLKEYIVLRGSKIGNYTLPLLDIDNIVIWYFNSSTKILEILPKTKYTIDIKKKIFTITDTLLPDLESVIITVDYNKKFINLLADFKIPDFSFLKTLNIPIYNSSYVNKQQLAPKYNGSTILNATVYSKDIYLINQNNNLLTGDNNEPFATISTSLQYTDFFTWYNQKLPSATSLYNYYVNLITSLNNFITNNTIVGLVKPSTVNVNATSLLLMGTDFDTTMENVVKPLYQYQIDYYNEYKEIIDGEYIETSALISKVANFDPIFNDNTDPLLNSVIKINSPVFDNTLNRYVFSGINKEGIDYNRLDSSAIQNNLSYKKWKEYYDNGGANNLLYHHLIIPSTTYDINYVLQSSTTNIININTSFVLTVLFGIITVNLNNIDSISDILTSDGQTILLTNRTNKAENGPWIIKVGNWERPSWFSNGSIDTYGGINFNIIGGNNDGNGYTVFANGDLGSKWILATDNNITVDTTEIEIKKITTLKDSVTQDKVFHTALDNTIATPPLIAGDSDSYIVPIGATGSWLGQGNKIAYSVNGGKNWWFYTARIGDVFLISSGVNVNKFYQWNGASWSLYSLPTTLDTNGSAKSQEFNTFADNAKKLYEPFLSAVQKVFDDYNTYVGTVPPITQVDATNNIVDNDSVSAQIVYGMIQEIVNIRYGTAPSPYSNFLLTVQKPSFVKYEYFIIYEKKPFYLKGNNQMAIFENTELEFGDYYNMVSDPSSYVYGQNGEVYNVFINKVEYNNFKNYYNILSQYINSITLEINNNIDYLLNYAKAINIQFNGQEYKNKIIYNIYNLDSIQTEINNIFAKNDIIMNNERTANQSLDKIFNNIAYLYQNWLLSLKINPLCIDKIDTIVPAIPNTFEQKSYSLIQRNNIKADKMAHDWGATIDNTTGGTYNQKLLDFLNLKGSDKDAYINLYKQTKISDYQNDYLHFFVGEISTFSTRNGSWHITDGTLFDKRVNKDLYNNLIDKITVSAIQGSNQYTVMSQSKGYVLSENMAIFSKDSIFTIANISSVSGNILTLDQVSQQTGTFDLEYINYFGAKINSINNNMFNIPNITEECCVGVNLTDSNYGFFIGSNEHEMLDTEMPQVSVRYQNNVLNGNGTDFCGGEYISCNYKNTTQERVAKKAKTKIDTRQKQIAIGKFYIRIE